MEKLEVTVREPADPSNPYIGALSEERVDGGGTNRVTLDSKKAEELTPQNKGGEEKLIFGKYKTIEEAEKGFKELESKLGAPAKKEETPATQSSKTKLSITPSESPKSELEAVQKAGLDLDALTEDFAQNGKLSDESYSKLEQAGLTKDKVNAYIDGQKALAEKFVATVAQSVGGEEKLQGLMQWAGANLSKAEIAVANKALASGDAAQATLTLEGIGARYAKAMGTDPSFIKGENRTVMNGPPPLVSADDIVAAMSDKRYQTSETYRKEVERRINAGIPRG
jgi:hypothetical protein